MVRKWSTGPISLSYTTGEATSTHGGHTHEWDDRVGRHTSSSSWSTGSTAPAREVLAVARNPNDVSRPSDSALRCSLRGAPAVTRACTAIIITPHPVSVRARRRHGEAGPSARGVGQLTLPPPRGLHRLRTPRRSAPHAHGRHAWPVLCELVAGLNHFQPRRQTVSPVRPPHSLQCMRYHCRVNPPAACSVRIGRDMRGATHCTPPYTQRAEDATSSHDAVHASTWAEQHPRNAHGCRTVDRALRRAGRCRRRGHPAGTRLRGRPWSP
jgi:hypothetical protein